MRVRCLVLKILNKRIDRLILSSLGASHEGIHVTAVGEVVSAGLVYRILGAAGGSPVRSKLLDVTLVQDDSKRDQTSAGAFWKTPQ